MGYQTRLFSFKDKNKWPEVIPIRNAVLKYISNGNTKAQICRSLGLIRNNKVDTTRLDRLLGIASTKSNGIKRDYPNKRIKYDIAVRIIRAINLDPVDFGL